MKRKLLDNMSRGNENYTEEIIYEGHAKIYTYIGKISKRLPVFYNPIMADNRTFSLLVIRALNKKGLKIALPLAASGIRGIRFLKELPKDTIKEIHFNDINSKAIEIIRENLKLNNIQHNDIFIHNKDARIFLLENRPFDYIDIDPFGTPNPFLDAAILSLRNNGILAITATDTAPLCGTYIQACLRKYWAKPLHNYLMNEIGLRILIRRVQLIGISYEIALFPIFSYSKDHYFRVFFIAKRSKSLSDKILKMHKELVFINLRNDSTNINVFDEIKETVNKDFLYDFKISSNNNLELIKDYIKPSFLVDNLFLNDNLKKIADCKSIKKIEELDKISFGPLWISKINDPNLIDNMIPLLPIFLKSNKKLKELEKFLITLKDESLINTLGFYDLHSLAKVLGTNVPKKKDIIKFLDSQGFETSSTIFSSTSVRTRAPLSTIINFMRSIQKK